jgi:endonuclease/exonuclease/phosphatase family metal-dependent hydrolase
MRILTQYIIIISLLLCGCQAVAAQQGMETEPVPKPLDMKIMTLNIHSGVNWQGQYDIDSLARFIAEANPDIVALQEVDRVWSNRSQFVDICAELAQRLQMMFTFSASLARNQGYFGNEILSKYPVVQAWAEKMPGKLEARSFVFSQVIISGIRVNLLNTHLGLSDEDRIVQVESIIKFLNQIDGPTVITGDFNGTSEDKAVALLRNEFFDIQSHTEQASQGTFRSKDGSIGDRMDYILTSPEFTLKRFEVVDNLLSDHLPLIAELELRVNPTQVAGEPVFGQ